MKLGFNVVYVVIFYFDFACCQWQVFFMNQKLLANFQLILGMFPKIVFLIFINGVVVAVATGSLAIGNVFASA